jgi:serine protease Do
VRTDLALLVIDPTGLDLKTAPWGDASLLEPGDWLVSVGQPIASARLISAGIASARRYGLGMAPGDEWLETDAVVNSASSGGPLVNLKGEVVGLCTLLPAGRGGYSGMGYAIPAGRVRRIAGELAEFGRVRRAFLGVQIESVELSRPVGAAGEVAVVISSVSPGTPAAESGLRAGDRLLKVGDELVASAVMLQSLIEFAPIGEELTVTIERDGKRLDVKVRPQAQPSPVGPRFAPGQEVPPRPVRGDIRRPLRNPPRGTAPRVPYPPGDQEPGELAPIPARGRPPERPAPVPPSSPDGGGRL